ncbi:MAG: class I SAM-dependent methyltransferase [Candidatus Odinarchaeota archaeon]|nr:class I SAM-dependent methyltransferase [Candidatus Odinarchaeota archaeon]
MTSQWDTIYLTTPEYSSDNTPSAEIQIIETFVSLIKQNIQKKLGNRTVRILDVGCGAGRYTIYLAKKGFYVFGIDSSRMALNMFIDKLGRLPGDVSNRIVVRYLNFHNLSVHLKNVVFDAILASHSIEHCNSVQEFIDLLKQLSLLLNSQGLFLAIIPSIGKKPHCTKQVSEHVYLCPEGDANVVIPHILFTKKLMIKLFKLYFNIEKYGVIQENQVSSYNYLFIICSKK